MVALSRIHRALQSGEARSGLFPYGVDTLHTLQKIRRSGAFASFREEIRRDAGRAMNTAVPPLLFSDFRQFDTTGSRSEYEGAFFDRRRRLLALVLAALLEDTDVYVRPLHDLIWDICNEYSWAVPAHIPRAMEARKHKYPARQAVDLFAAETSHALAETIYVLKDRLDPHIVEHVRSEIEYRVFMPVFDESLPHHWETKENNWPSVCGGSIGMAALLLEEDRDRLTVMLHRAIGALESFLEGIGADGGCAEGPDYWMYGFGYYVYFSEMLFVYTGGRLNLLCGDKIRKLALFPSALLLSGGKVVNYSDSAEQFELHLGLASKLKQRFGLEGMSVSRVNSLHADASYRYAHTMRNVFWSDESLLRPAGMAPGPVFFPDLAWMVDRRVIDGEMIAFSAKGGHNAEPHNHNDLGHFIVHVAGDNVLADAGKGRYTKSYFGSARYEHLHPSSKGHSVPVIDGQGQLAGRERAAQVLAYDSGEDRSVFSLELADAYGIEALLSLQRRFVWRKRADSAAYILELSDVFRFRSEPERMEEVFVSLIAPEIREEGIVRWKGSRGQVEFDCAAAGWLPEVERISAQTGDGATSTVYRLCLRNPAPGKEAAFHAEFVCSLYKDGE